MDDDPDASRALTPRAELLAGRRRLISFRRSRSPMPGIWSGSRRATRRSAIYRPRSDYSLWLSPPCLIQGRDFLMGLFHGLFYRSPASAILRPGTALWGRGWRSCLGRSPRLRWPPKKHHGLGADPT